MSLETVKYNSWQSSRYNPLFEEYLVNSKKIQLSLTPNVPGNEENKDRKYIDHEFYMTNTGLVLIIRLVDLDDENNEEYNVIYSDIESIEMHDSAHFKFYIECINRDKKGKYDEAFSYKENGLTLSKEDIKALNEDYIDTYRVLLTL
ncbi:hypothetical protein [Halolactibacillus sp. JCM 19043]|uniref:hypothetical protein n=1 Tax=Halolactibacillus sp. JCM 19043 TaxID=1460638 RepID=UPI000782C3FB|nr:hypothetical protein [Halolactibacillus sp. JCM 19043]